MLTPFVFGLLVANEACNRTAAEAMLDIDAATQCSVGYVMLKEEISGIQITDNASNLEAYLALQNWKKANPEIVEQAKDYRD